MIIVPPGCEKVISKRQMRKGKAEQVDEASALFDEEEKEEAASGCAM